MGDKILVAYEQIFYYWEYIPFAIKYLKVLAPFMTWKIYVIMLIVEIESLVEDFILII